METVSIFEIKRLLSKAQSTIGIALHALNTKVLIGEINRPAGPIEKKPRKKRTPKAKVEEVWSPGKESVPVKLPDTDKDHPFYVKPKRGRKKKALYKPTNEGEAT